MNHPRRLLLFVPFALLGAALLVRARLPRPQTESDKWLWEQGEKAERLEVTVTPYWQAEMGLNLPYSQQLIIRDRSAMRAVLRALENTGPFGANTSASERVFDEGAFVQVEVWQSGRVNTLLISNTKGGYFMCRLSDASPPVQKVATTNAPAVKKMLEALRSDLQRAKRNEEGCRLVPVSY